jgi:hypothetical protein
MSDPEIYLEKDRLSQRLLAGCLIFRHDFTLQRELLCMTEHAHVRLTTKRFSLKTGKICDF